METQERREGPIVISFQPHLLGEGEGAFNCDTALIPALAKTGSTPEFNPYDVVAITGWDDTLGVALCEVVSESVVAGLGIAVVQSVVDDTHKRSDAGYSNGLMSGRTLYAVKRFGVAKVSLESTVDMDSLVHGDDLYLKSDSKALTNEESADFTLFGQFVAKALSDTMTPSQLDGFSTSSTPDSEPDNLAWVTYGIGLSGGGNTFPNDKVPLWHKVEKDENGYTWVTVYGGVLSTPSNGNIAIAAKTFEPSYGTEYIYVKWAYGASASIESAGARPSITGTAYVHMLVTLALDVVSDTWSPETYNHTGGDIVLSPVV
jgi:hypothetical protein